MTWNQECGLFWNPETGNTTVLMLVFDTNVINSCGEWISRFYIVRLLSIALPRSYMNIVSSLCEFSDCFDLIFSFLSTPWVCVTPPSHSCVSGLRGGAAGAEKSDGRLLGAACGPWPREDDKQQQQQHPASVWLLRLSDLTRIHLLSLIHPDASSSFYCFFSATCWELLSCCFAGAGVQFPAGLQSNKTPLCFWTRKQNHQASARPRRLRQSVPRKSWKFWTVLSRSCTGTGTSASCPRPGKSTVSCTLM